MNVLSCRAHPCVPGSAPHDFVHGVASDRADHARHQFTDDTDDAVVVAGRGGPPSVPCAGRATSHEGCPRALDARQRSVRTTEQRYDADPLRTLGELMVGEAAQRRRGATSRLRCVRVSRRADNVVASRIRYERSRGSGRVRGTQIADGVRQPRTQTTVRLRVAQGSPKDRLRDRSMVRSRCWGDSTHPPPCGRQTSQGWESYPHSCRVWAGFAAVPLGLWSSQARAVS